MAIFLGDIDLTTGRAGRDGKSAFEYARESGYMGTEEEFSVSLNNSKFIETNHDTPMSIWIGLKSEYDTITEQIENCLYIITDYFEEPTVELTTNKTTVVNANSTDQQYPSAKAVWSAITDISGYEKTENKDTIISNASDDNHYPSSKAVYDNVNKTVNSAKETILQTVEDRVYGVEKQSNKVTEITEDAKHTTYPSSKAVLDAIEAFGGSDIETTDVIDENSTTEQVPNAKAVYDFVMNTTPDSVPVIYSSTSMPTSNDGKIGDLWVVI